MVQYCPNASDIVQMLQIPPAAAQPPAAAPGGLAART
eukprot:COSAG01_NODE_45843_length_405_cov_6.120915_1_plen_36_part_10